MEERSYFLRGLNFKDKEYLLNWNRDEEIRRLTGALYSVSEIEHEEWFKNKSISKTEKMWCIVDFNSKEPIGVVGLKNFDYISRNSELYIYIGEKKFWGKGIGSKVTSQVLQIAFENLNLHKVYLSVFSYNLRAIKMYEKIGFQVEGELIDNVFRDGKFHNTFIMGKIRS